MLRKMMPVLLKHSAKAACKEMLEKIRPEAVWGIVGFSLGFLVSCCVSECRPKHKRTGGFWPR